MREGPFRIGRRQGNPIAAQSADNDKAGEDLVKDYMGRLVALIPAEVISLYLVLRAIFANPSADLATQEAAAPSEVAILAWICVALTAATRIWGTHDESGAMQSVQKAAVLVATISFAILV
jgi:hypothetical protein